MVSSPARILGRHPHDEAANLQEHVGPSRPALRIRPFPGDELPVPAKNRVGYTIVATSAKIRRPRGAPSTAKRRRSSSVSLTRLLRTCAFRTRFSSRRYSMISCYPLWNQPMIDATSRCSGTTLRVYVNCRAMFSDTTGLTQGALARRTGADGKAVVCQWESRKRTPSPVRWQGVLELEGQPA